MKKNISIFALLLMLTASAFAQVPQTLSYQGILTDAAGNPVANGTHTVIFDFYPLESGGSADFSIGPINVSTNKGLFTTLLGNIPDSLGKKQYYVGIIADGEVLAPRITLSSVPYALKALTASTVALPLRGVGIFNSSTTSDGYRSSVVTGINVANGVPDGNAAGNGLYGETASAAFGASQYAGVQGRSTAATFGFGVSGSAAGTGSAGVYGSSDNNGVYGYTSNGAGVRGKTVGAGAAVVAEGNGATSLEINNGALKVSGAAKTAFKHEAVIANTIGNYTVIDNPLCNGDPNAIIIVTHNYNRPSGGTSYLNKAFGVYYAIGQWRIYLEDQATSIVDQAFNVLIIKQ